MSPRPPLAVEGGAARSADTVPALPRIATTSIVHGVDEELTTALARHIVELQAVVSAQGEMIARLLAIAARTSTESAGMVAAERLDEERAAYLAAVLPGDDASASLLSLMSRKAEAKRAIFDLAERMLAPFSG